MRHGWRWLWLGLGLYICALGIALMAASELGVGAWEVLHFGLTRHLPIGIGFAMQGVGALIIALGWWLGIRPTYATFINMLTIGPMVQWNLTWLPTFGNPGLRWLCLAAGTLVLGLGIATYTSAGMGAGPRDGLMIGLTRRLGWPVALVKNGIELVALCLGWLLGGPVGIGTLAVSITLGPAVQTGMALVRMLARLPGLRTFVRPVDLRRTTPAPTNRPSVMYLPGADRRALPPGASRRPIQYNCSTQWGYLHLFALQLYSTMVIPKINRDVKQMNRAVGVAVLVLLLFGVGWYRYTENAAQASARVRNAESLLRDVGLPLYSKADFPVTWDSGDSFSVMFAAPRAEKERVQTLYRQALAQVTHGEVLVEESRDQAGHLVWRVSGAYDDDRTLTVRVVKTGRELEIGVNLVHTRDFQACKWEGTC